MINNMFFFIESFIAWLCSIPTETWMMVVVVGIVLGIISFLLRHAVKALIIIGTMMVIITSLLALV